MPRPQRGQTLLDGDRYTVRCWVCGRGETVVASSRIGFGVPLVALCTRHGGKLPPPDNGVPLFIRSTAQSRVYS